MARPAFATSRRSAGDRSACSAWGRIERSLESPSWRQRRSAPAQAERLARSHRRNHCRCRLACPGRDHPEHASRPTAPAAQPMVAIIQAGNQVAAVASWDRSSRRLLVSEVNMPIRPRHDYQLWLIPAGGKPHSLGVMPARPHMQLALAEPISAMYRPRSDARRVARTCRRISHRSAHGAGRRLGTNHGCVTRLHLITGFDRSWVRTQRTRLE